MNILIKQDSKLGKQHSSSRKYVKWAEKNVQLGTRDPHVLHYAYSERVPSVTS